MFTPDPVMEIVPPSVYVVSQQDIPSQPDLSGELGCTDESETGGPGDSGILIVLSDLIA
jgi:hypothetical protein